MLREPHCRCRYDNPIRLELCAESPWWWMLWQLLFEFLLRGVNGYLAGLFYVKLCAKRTVYSCYRHSLRQEHTNSSVVGWAFSELVASIGGAQQQTPGSFETKLWEFFYRRCGCEVVSTSHLCYVPLCSPSTSLLITTSSLKNSKLFGLREWK